MEWLTQHKIPIGKWARTLFDWLQGNFSFAFDALSDTLEAMIEAILWLLQAPPPVAIIALFMALAYGLQRSWRAAALVGCGFLFILNQG